MHSQPLANSKQPALQIHSASDGAAMMEVDSSTQADQVDLLRLCFHGFHKAARQRQVIDFVQEHYKSSQITEVRASQRVFFFYTLS